MRTTSATLLAAAGVVREVEQKNVGSGMIKFIKEHIFLAGLSFTVAVVIVAGAILYLFAEKVDIPFVGRASLWSIGIYEGRSPFFPSPHAENPVMTAGQVTDVRARFVADPFMVQKGGAWYMFFEVMNDETDQGDIGLAISADGFDWVYRGIVLDEPFHLSYPYVFNWQGDYYMVPESNEAGSVRLYRALEFPTKWHLVTELLSGIYVDPSLFRYGDMWWLFVGENLQRNDTLRLFYSASLAGPFIEHPRSPIVAGDANIARPAGRVLVLGDQIVRFAQDDDPTYGNQVWAFSIYRLTTEIYEEMPVGEGPVLKNAGRGWNGAGMHNIDAHLTADGRWIACVDGYRARIVFGPGY